MRNQRKLLCGMICVLILSMPVLTTDALALRVTVKRVIFEGPQRSEVLTIINNSDREQTYRLGWRPMRMHEDQPLTPIAEDEHIPDLHDLQDMVRFSPRRAVVPAGGVQQVRLMLRRPRDLPDGEYRSHFFIQPEASAPPFTNDMADSDETAIQIEILTGISLPVFVRHGTLSAQAGITNLFARRKGDRIELSMTLTRSGNRSLYGDLEFSCDNAQGPIQARQVNGIALYTEVSQRNFTYEIPIPNEADCSQLKITYRADRDDRQYRGQILAEREVQVH